jgi:DNA polymerase III alpha subunit
MAAKFADLPEALANTVAIAQRCNLTIALGRNHLPEFPTPPGVTIDEHLRVRSTSPGSTSKPGRFSRWASPATS